MVRWIGTSAAVICVLMCVATGLALIETDEWWIRVLDFPRLQIAAVLLIALLIYRWTGPCGATAGALLTAASVVALLWQAWMIVPYTAAWPQQLLSAEVCTGDARVRFLLANVLQENRQFDRLLDLVAETDADIILLTEIDDQWTEAIEPLAGTYPYTILEPLSNTYGIGLYSRLPLIDGEIRHILEEDIPSIRTRVTLTDQIEFALWGVHPSPPRPKDDTDERDAELLIVAKEASDASLPAIVAGDLNDVAWSSTTTLFQEISGLLDPRIGRGLYATFNANWPLMKWPLDHLFASQDWLLGEFRRLDDIGSDHFPILVELCHQPQAAGAQEGNQPEGGDRQEANEHIEEGREAAE
ncbi:endonuclease/exonuclease/phosphatase family protein [Pararhizobium haloflavum]|uniref:endonuclease/exonuclease/phosphatase family protein n=1 Tax=Pararhizobium haloflavum TaxID=2037914 RepID=UPI000C182DE4|nr:endonuclease/exonuclease/phosphatase family protein [Pararhizobium haloflavum]